MQALQNFGLSGVLATYLRGLDSEGVEWGPELRELRFQAAWRNTQWDCDLPERSGTCFPITCVCCLVRHPRLWPEEEWDNMAVCLCNMKRWLYSDFYGC